MTTIFEFLRAEGLIDPARAVKLSDRARDAEIAAFRDSKSGVVYLDPEAAGVATDYYEAKDTGAARHPRQEMDVVDTVRRSPTLVPLISGKRWADIGCGPGYQLRHDVQYTSAHLGIELNAAEVKLLTEDGFTVSSDVTKVKEFAPQAITFLHVLHCIMTAPDLLRDLYDWAAPGCTLFIEGPQARDLLLVDGPEAFKRHTFHSEQLVLHTRESLRALAESAGWKVRQVMGLQRYPIGNHWAWLTKGKATGARELLTDPLAQDLHRAYGAYLAANDATDTLMLVAEKV
jgi:hypothetical protein